MTHLQGRKFQPHDVRSSAVLIALTPFENLSGDPSEEYFARGFVEDLAADLSRFGTFEVLYPRAVEVFLRPPADGSAADGLPDGAHILRGTIRRTGDVTRITTQLVNTGGRQIWADRYDATADRLLDVQDEIAARIAGALAVHVDEARLVQARRKPLANLEVYDLWLRGLDLLQRGTAVSDTEARALFERAMAIDPGYARAYAGMSLSYFNEWSCMAWERWDDTERNAYQYAQRAVALDDSDQIAQVVLARILLYRRRFDEAVHHLERAVSLNPNHADVLAHAGWGFALLGEGQRGIELTGKARRLNPRHPQWYLAAEMQSLFVAGDFPKALATALGSPYASVDLPGWLAAAAALSGDIDHARVLLDRYLTLFRERITFGRPPEPGEPLRWLMHVNPFRRKEDADKLAQGLHLAGLEQDPDDTRAEAAPHPVNAESRRPMFRSDGPFWTMAFERQEVQLTTQKGFRDLARLLSQPGVEVHCLELTNRPDEGAGDPVIDERARREIQTRIRELQREIDAADARHDLGAAERAREELDRIVEMLSGALGLGGRARRIGSAAERARSAVTWRIRSAVRKIASAHPRLGRHLDNSVRTGTFCAYDPETAVHWDVRDDSA